MTILNKLLLNAREVYYRRARIWLGWNPRRGVCEACGKTVKKKQITRSNMHHHRYAYTTNQVRKNPKLALHHTSELCYPCHRLADAIRQIEEAMRKKPEIVKKLFELQRRKY